MWCFEVEVGCFGVFVFYFDSIGVLWNFFEVFDVVYKVGGIIIVECDLFLLILLVLLGELGVDVVVGLL